MSTLNKKLSRCLSDLKYVDVNIGDKLNSQNFVTVYIKDKTLDGQSLKKYNESVNAKVKSIRDMIDDDIKNRMAIATANMDKVIQIGKKEMTITEALLYRQYEVPRLKQLLNKLRNDMKDAKRVYQNKMEKHNERINALMKDSDEGSNEEDLKNIKANLEPNITNIDHVIEKLQEEINFFEQEFDHILSEVNPTIDL